MNIINVGSYWYDDKKRKKNREFDCALKKEDGYTILEVKFLKDRMSQELAEKEEKKIRDIEELKVNEVGFVSLNGFDFSSDKYLLISGSDLVKEELEGK